jgi:hypothetical protein
MNSLLNRSSGLRFAVDSASNSAIARTFRKTGEGGNRVAGSGVGNLLSC